MCLCTKTNQVTMANQDPNTYTGIYELVKLVMDKNSERDKILVESMSNLNLGRQFSMLPDQNKILTNLMVSPVTA